MRRHLQDKTRASNRLPASQAIKTPPAHRWIRQAASASLSFFDGNVSQFTPGGTDWAGASLNIPATTGSGFWTDAGAHAEIEIAGEGPYGSANSPSST